MTHVFKQKNEFKNYYEVLEIPTTSTQMDVNKAYKKAKNTYLVDNIALHSVMTKEECNAVLELVEEAYSVLSVPAKRAAYDRAKGFQEKNKKNNSFDNSSPDSLREPEPSKDENNLGISKVAALNHFALDYTIDPSMEEKIKNCQKFTGELLKEIREYKKVDIPRMNNMTKISKNYLKNIEDDNIDDLPALTYIRGFVYQYAKSLQLNPEEVANSYISRFKTDNK